jgi:hypothetical protein
VIIPKDRDPRFITIRRGGCSVLAAAGTASAEVVVHLTLLLDRLDELLIGASFDANTWYGEGA